MSLSTRFEIFGQLLSSCIHFDEIVRYGREMGKHVVWFYTYNTFRGLIFTHFVIEFPQWRQVLSKDVNKAHSLVI